MLMFKDLGVVFDSRLTFVQHIEEVASSAYKSLGFILRQAKHFTNFNTLTTLYKTFVRSRLEYACVVWSPFYDVHISSFEKVQRRLAKYLLLPSDGVYPARGYPHSELLCQVNLPTLPSRR